MLNNPLQDLQIIPPWNDDKKFEQFILDYYNELDNVRNYSLYGRSGQKQYGIDIYSTDKETVIQCKLRLIENQTKDKIRKGLIKELKEDFQSFLEFNAKHNSKFTKFIFATTSAPDVEIDDECIKLSLNNLGITVEYWHWNKLMQNLPDAIRDKYYKDFITRIDDYYYEIDEGAEIKPLAIQYNFDYALPIIDRIYNFFDYVHNQLGYVPINILKNSYPFKKSDTYYPYYSIFTLTTDNDDFFELLKSLDITENSVKTKNRDILLSVKGALRKIKYILEVLSSQLIFHIRHSKSHEVLSIRYSHEKACKCVRCTFDRQEYNNTIRLLNKKPRSIELKLKYAYTHYQMGHFLKAYEYYEQASKLATKKKKYLLYATIQYSLSKLYIHIRNEYWNEQEAIQPIKKLKAINLYKVLREVKNENSEVVSWIFNTNFFTTKFEEINDLVNKIRDTYYNQLKGGFSSNNHIWELINRYAELDSFLELNYIVYNQFTEFQKLTRIFIEGLFISYGIRSEGTSRLEQFDDWILQKILANGKPEDVKKYFFRYELRPIDYEPTSGSGSTFIDVANNLFINKTLYVSQFETSEHPNFIFWDKYDRILNNTLILLAILEIDKKEVRRIAKNIYLFLKDFTPINKSYIDNLTLFLDKKGDILEGETLYVFLELYLKDGIYHNERYLEVIVTKLINNNQNISFPQEFQKQFIENELGICLVCGFKHRQFLMPHLYLLIKDTGFKNKMRVALQNELILNFNPNVYYNSAINDMISDDGMFNMFVDSISPKMDKLNLKNVILKTQSNRNRELNNLINLCFQKDIDLQQNKFKQFKGLNDYYDWLLDLKNFDYDKFDPFWTIEYPTVYYYKEFAKHSIIKEKIGERLMEKKDLRLEKVFIELSLIK